MPNYSYLDAIARGVRETGDTSRVGPLSTGERIYVALATDRLDLLPAGYGIAAGLDRLEPELVAQLITSWRAAGLGT
jgi:hypothetical protein